MPRPRKLLAEMCGHQGNRCFYCGRAMTTARETSTTATIDHMTPKSRGGANWHGNLVAACLRCNGIKGAMTVDEFRILYPTPADIPPIKPKRPRVSPAAIPDAAGTLARLRAKDKAAKRTALADATGPWTRRDGAGFDPAEMGLAATPILTLAELWPAL